MNFRDWKPLNRTTAEYIRSIDRFVREFFPDNFDQHRTRELLLDPDFPIASDRIAKRMITGLMIRNAQSWKDAARKSSRGITIRASLQNELLGPVGVVVKRIIAENAELIRSIPARLAQYTTAYIAGQQYRGLRSEEIEVALRRNLKHLTRTHIRLIARTEISKAETALTKARSQRLGIQWYEWESSHDERVRDSHRLMSGVLVNWNDPPAPELLDGIKSTLGHYQAGCAPACRCVALPLVSIDDISWPHRAYMHGKIQNITRAQFIRLSSIPAAA